MITQNNVYKKFNYFVNKAQFLLSKGKFELACDCAKLACVLAKNYYLCYEDERLEEFISKASNTFSPFRKKIQNGDKSSRFVFYDTHTTDNIALTQQYLGALLSWNVNFLYITTKNLNTSKTAFIKTMLDSSGRVTINLIPTNLSAEKQVMYIIDTVQRYSPHIALIQTISDDVIGTIAWNFLNSIERFYIDLSDHSFWLGAKTFDYFIAFRNYGVNISIQHRKINPERIFIQPFYPILKSKRFQGLPHGEGKIKLLSGGRIEKIYGQKDKYFELIKNILLENKNTILYFVGGGAFGKVGETAYIKKKWKELGIEDRVFMLGFRNDIVELYKNVDLYIGTFPMGGGLMSQIAASQGLPVVQYASDGLSMCLGEFFLPNKFSRKFVFIDDEKGFYDEVKFLINNREARTKQGKEIKKSVISKEKFNEQLYILINEKRDSIDREIYHVDCEHLRANQFELENNCHHSYSRILIKSKYIRKYKPVEFVVNMIALILYSDKKWLFNLIKSKFRMV